MLGTNTWKSNQGKVLTLANSITASRLIFFIGFIWELKSENLLFAMVYFGIAWGLDAIDGSIARAMRQDSIFGSQLDKAIDRIIIIGSVIALLRYEYIPSSAVFLLVKDIGLSIALSLKPLNKGLPSSGVAGKALSVCQGVAIFGLVFGFPFQSLIISGIAIWGAIVAVLYLRKM